MRPSPSPALMLVDLQVAFFSAGPLADLREVLVRRSNALHGWATEFGLPIFLVRTQHCPDRSTWTLNMLEDDQGFLIRGEPDTEPLPGLIVQGTRDVVKTRDSAFHDTDLSSQLQALKIDTLVMAGVSTHTCVASTAADAYARDLHVVLAQDAIASHRPHLHQPTLDLLRDEFRFDHAPVDGITSRTPEALRRTPPG